MLYRYIAAVARVAEEQPGPGLRAVLACGTAMALCLAAGPAVIAWLERMNLREKTEKTPIEDAALRERISSKSGTPTMGGLALLGALIASVLVWADVTEPPVAAAVFCVAALAALGVADDVLKLRGAGHRGRGLRPRQKLLYQASVGMVVGLILVATAAGPAEPSTPLSPAALLGRAGRWAGLLFVAWAAVVVGTMSNATNITDGVDGLLSGLAPLAGVVMAGACWAAGNAPLAAALHISYVPGAGELAVFCAALAGACVGFLWFNRHPARVFMGDTGALALGGGLAVAAVAARMEAVLAVVGIVFLAELGSSLLQIATFKVCRRRIFPIAPIHHIFERKGYTEPRIVSGFYLWGALAALLGVNLICL